MLRTLTLAAGLFFATVAAAQDTTPQQSAVRANDQAAAVDATRGDAATAVNVDAQAQYSSDLAAYDAALARHDAQADRTAARYHHQQRAYADAMAAWRAQDYACRHGSNRACNAPSPDPSSFW